MSSSKLLPDNQLRSNRLVPIVSRFLVICFLVSCFLVILFSFILIQGWIGPWSWKGFFESSSSTLSCPIQKYDYTLLTIRWPPGICKSTDCIEDYPQRWLIHGLWPNFANGSWPQFCCPSSPFDLDQVRPLRPQLESNWANLEDGRSADSLWEHEWDKHGTCSTLDAKLRGEFNYFNFTLSLFYRTPVTDWLRESSITPDDHAVLRYSLFYNSIHKHFQKRFLLLCQKIGSKIYLQQIQFCFDKITFQLRDCDPQLNSASCRDGFLYTSRS